MRKRKPGDPASGRPGAKPPRVRVVQDSAREEKIARHCGLLRTGDRAGPDARDGRGNVFELKSTTRGAVTTARDVGLHTLRAWRRTYWIIAGGENLESGFEIRELYVGHPDDLEPWFRRIASKLRTARRDAGLVLAAARRVGVPSDVRERVGDLLRRGTTINNPHIPMVLIRSRLRVLDAVRPDVATREVRLFVRGRPIR